MKKFDDFLEEQLKDEEFRKEYERLQIENELQLGEIENQIDNTTNKLYC